MFQQWKDIKSVSIKGQWSFRDRVYQWGAVIRADEV